MKRKFQSLTVGLASKSGVYLLIFVVVGGIGSYLLYSSHAATPTASLEPEAGTVSTCGVKLSDTSASGGGSVKFTNCGGFTHPGVFLDKAQLDYVKNQINFTQVATGATSTSYNQWTNAYIKAVKRTTNTAGATGAAVTDQSRLDFTPSPVATLDCTANKPACTGMWAEDAAAAYSQALLYYYAPTGYANKDTYAQNSVKILNAWATTLTSASTANGAQLDAAWAVESFTKAAEIMRYTYTPPAGEANLNVAKLKTMFTMLSDSLFDVNNTADQPAIYSSNGNWHLSMIDANIGIAVFNDDTALYNQVVSEWKDRVSSYFYLTSDNGGNGTPLTPPGTYYNSSDKIKCYWYAAGSPTTTCGYPAGFVSQNGLLQETCRDRSHAGMGMDSAIMAAQTAYVQGTDLYKEYQTRLLTGIAAQAKYNDYADTNKTFIQSYCNGDPVKDSGTGSDGLGLMAWEIVYNHYVREDTSYGLTSSSPQMVDVVKMITRYQPTPVLQQGVLDTLSSSAYDKNHPS